MTEEVSLDPKKAVKVKAGTKLITENESTRTMYVIMKGKARVFKLYLGQRITLAVLGEGEIVGEMGFIEAQPRSASVEALTDMEVMVLDGAKGSDQLKNLPSWIWTIFRTVFQRFRELDREIVALRSAVNYRKKGMKTDIVASTIYFELVRFIRTLLLIYSERSKAGQPVKSTALFEDMDSVLGNRAIGLRPFWKLLQDFDFFEDEPLTKRDEIVISETRMHNFDEFLKNEIKLERYQTISHGALSVLRRIIGYLENTDGKDTESFACSLTSQELKLRSIPNYEEALKEFETTQIIPYKDEVFEVAPIKVHELYIYHSIIKNFDYTSIYTD